MDPSTPHPRPPTSHSETPERFPSSASPLTTTKPKQHNSALTSSRRATLGNMGVHKRSGSGVGTRALNGGGVSNPRTQYDLIPITADMTQEQRELTIEQNKHIESWADDRARNNMSAKRSRLKKMMYIVDMDNTIKEYAHNVMEFKHAYDMCKAVILRHNLQSELGHAFVEPVVWQRPDVMRDQETDIAEHRTKLEKEAEKKELYELGLEFAEKLRFLVKKTGAAERSVIAKALEEHRQKVEECARKEAHYEAQMKDHERKAAEMKVKLQEVQKQQAEYRIASEKYGPGVIGGGGQAKLEDTMELDPVPEAIPAKPVKIVLQTREGPFVVQGPNPPPFPAPHDAPKDQEGDDFAQKGKTEIHISTSYLALQATNEEHQAQKELEDEVEQWAQSQADIINPNLFGSGYDGLPGTEFPDNFGFNGEAQYYSPVGYNTPQQQSSPAPIHEGLSHNGNVTNANPTVGNSNNVGSSSNLDGGASAYDSGGHWFGNYQRHPLYSPPAPVPFLDNAKGSGQHGLTSQSHTQTQTQTQTQHQPDNPVWDHMQNGYNGGERTFGENFDT